MNLLRVPLIALSLVTLVGCPGEPGGEGDEAEESGDTSTSGQGDDDGDGELTTSGDGDGDATTPGDGDGDPTTGGPLCGNGVVDEGEACDDGNLSDFDECTTNCLLNICGDGLVQANVEECDDGNNVSDDGCSSECVAEFCGDGVIQAHEECDDSNMIDSDECTANCTIAVCGDGSLLADVETCDDGNDDDSDSCPSSCHPAVCGDGFVLADIEECDDANDEFWDGCTPVCEPQVAVRPKLMVCGYVEREITDFFPPELELEILDSCTPDDETQVLIISGNENNGPDPFDAQLVREYVAAGGIVITEHSSSDEVFNAVFQTNVVQGPWSGGCQARFPAIHQYNADDPFWDDNEWHGPIPDWSSGCGYDISSFPGITPLAGWSPNTVAAAYRDHEAGRVWLAEFNWANAFGDFNMTTTFNLMGYMMTRGQLN